MNKTANKAMTEACRGNQDGTTRMLAMNAAMRALKAGGDYQAAFQAALAVRVERALGLS